MSNTAPKNNAPAASAPHWRKVLGRANKDFLFSEDIGPVGSHIDVEITESGSATIKGADGKSDPLPWIGTWGKARKRLGLNVTNCKTLEAMCGTGDYTRWRGWIRLVVVRIEYFDTKEKKKVETDAIRIAPQRPRGGGAGRAAPESFDRDERADDPAGHEMSDEERRQIAADEAAMAAAERGDR